MSRCHWFLTGCLIVSLPVGCARPARSPTARTRAPVSAATDRQAAPVHVTRKPVGEANPALTFNPEAGVLSGWVRWEGNLPEATPPSADQPGQRLQVNGDNRGVADAVIWLSNPPEQRPAIAAEPVTLHQRDGEFQPH